MRERKERIQNPDAYLKVLLKSKMNFVVLSQESSLLSHFSVGRVHWNFSFLRVTFWWAPISRLRCFLQQKVLKSPSVIPEENKTSDDLRIFCTN